MSTGEIRPLDGIGALVTGGAGGIGSTSARFLARDGAVVTLMGRSQDKLDAAAKSIRDEYGADVRTANGDAKNPEDVERAIEAAHSAAGNLGICVATVGGGTLAPLLMFDDTQFLEDLNRNIVTAFLAIKYSTPRMVDSGGGSIVCISSDASKLSWPFMASYCAAKAGLDGLVRVAADELGSLGIRVNAVRPGLTKTNSGNVASVFGDPEMLAEFVRQKPLARTGVPEDIAAGVRFLAGPESAWVTGQSLAIEGGNELRRAPWMEKVVRARLGDASVETAMKGEIPTAV